MKKRLPFTQRPWVVRVNGKVMDRCYSEKSAKRCAGQFRRYAESVTVTHETKG